VTALTKAEQERAKELVRELHSLGERQRSYIDVLIRRVATLQALLESVREAFANVGRTQ